MSKARIHTKNDHKHHSDTWLIQDQLQQQSLPVMTAETDEETLNSHAKMCEYRDTEIQQIAEDAQHIKEMYQDFAMLAEEQQPVIKDVARTLQRANKRVQKAEETLVEVEKGRKCLIS